MAISSGGGLQATNIQSQWSSFRANTVGVWKGIQTGYDPQDDDVEDYMYTETTYATVEDEADAEEAIRQTNGFVLGEIRADCEVCYDSERLVTKEGGTYTATHMRNVRSLGNAELRGPSPTAKGLGAEIAFRHGDGRLRVLLAYSPLGLQPNGAPSSLGLCDVVVVRERLDKRPLQLSEDEGGFDEMWRPCDERSFDSLQLPGRVEAVQLYSYGTSVSGGDEDEKARLAVLPLLNERLDGTPAVQSGHHAASGADGDEEDDENNFLYRRALPGGVLVECLSIVMPGVPSRFRVSWVPSAVETKLHVADVQFAALEEAVEEAAKVTRFAPPSVRAFDVYSYQLCGNALF